MDLGSYDDVGRINPWILRHYEHLVP